jgi:hypothetical protein
MYRRSTYSEFDDKTTLHVFFPFFIAWAETGESILQNQVYYSFCENPENSGSND